MKSPLPAWLLMLLIGLVPGVLSSCASAPVDHEADPASARARGPVVGAKARVELRQGMKPEAVRQTLGNPERIQKVEVSEGEAEQWIYTRDRRTEVQQKATGTKEVPYFDPFLNQIRMVSEPVYSDEATTITEELHLFWHNGELSAWKTEYRTDRSYTPLN